MGAPSIPQFGPFRDFDFLDLPDALCRRVDPELFYPEQGDKTTPAIRVCKSCDVRFECLEWALDHKERFGVWGGMTPRQRRTLEKRRAAARIKAAA